MTDSTATTPLDPGSLGLPQIYQVGYIVDDVEATVARLNPLFGPFTVFESEISPVYRGVESPTCMKVAIGRSGSIEMEYIEVLRGDCPQKDWHDRHGESIMHVAVKVDDVDGECARLADLGFELVWRGDIPGTDIVYAYVRQRDDLGGHYLELTQGF